MPPCVPEDSRIRGFTSSTGAFSPSGPPTSMTTTRRSTPTWGAARPTPSASYMVSNMSSMSWESRSSKLITSRHFLYKQGSFSLRMVLIAMAYSSYIHHVIILLRDGFVKKSA